MGIELSRPRIRRCDRRSPAPSEWRAGQCGPEQSVPSQLCHLALHRAGQPHPQSYPVLSCQPLLTCPIVDALYPHPGTGPRPPFVSCLCPAPRLCSAERNGMIGTEDSRSPPRHRPLACSRGLCGSHSSTETTHPHRRLILSNSRGSRDSRPRRRTPPRPRSRPAWDRPAQSESDLCSASADCLP